MFGLPVIFFVGFASFQNLLLEVMFFKIGLTWEKFNRSG